MYNFKYLAFLLFCLSASVAQNKGLKCGWYGKKNLEERRNAFPFNKAKKVYLVAFPSYRAQVSIVNEDGGSEKKLEYDSISYSNSIRKIIEVVELPSKKRQIYLLTEKQKLEQPQIDELSNLLFNYTTNKKKKDLVGVSVSCYEPRNAVLFVDENEQVISYIEICFECFQYYQGPKETIENLGTLAHLEECFGKIEELKDFFKRNKIKYGIEER